MGYLRKLGPEHICDPGYETRDWASSRYEDRYYAVRGDVWECGECSQLWRYTHSGWSPMRWYHCLLWYLRRPTSVQ